MKGRAGFGGTGGRLGDLFGINWVPRARRVSRQSRTDRARDTLSVMPETGRRLMRTFWAVDRFLGGERPPTRTQKFAARYPVLPACLAGTIWVAYFLLLPGSSPRTTSSGQSEASCWAASSASRHCTRGADSAACDGWGCGTARERAQYSVRRAVEVLLLAAFVPSVVVHGATQGHMAGKPRRPVGGIPERKRWMRRQMIKVAETEDRSGAVSACLLL